MTTAPTTTRHPIGDDRSTTRTSRVPAAFRLQFIVPSNFIVVPAAIFILVWAVATGISFWVHNALDDRVPAEDPMYLGASQATVWTLGFMAAYTVTHTLPFAMAMSFSRRTFVAGAYLAFAAVSAVFGLAFMAFAWLEHATHGYGFHSYQFDIPPMTGSNGPAGAGLLAGVLCFTVMIVGFLSAAVFRRTSLLGFWSLIVAILGLMAVATVLLVQTWGWSGITGWVLEQTALTGTGYLLLVAVPAGVLGYLILRRDTPSN